MLRKWLQKPMNLSRLHENLFTILIDFRVQCYGNPAFSVANLFMQKSGPGCRRGIRSNYDQMSSSLFGTTAPGQITTRAVLRFPLLEGRDLVAKVRWDQKKKSDWPSDFPFSDNSFALKIPLLLLHSLIVLIPIIEAPPALISRHPDDSFARISPINFSAFIRFLIFLIFQDTTSPSPPFSTLPLKLFHLTSLLRFQITPCRMDFSIFLSFSIRFVVAQISHDRTKTWNYQSAAYNS